MSGGSVIEACSYCGSAELELFPDGSGRCKRCNMSFMGPSSVKAVQPDKLEMHKRQMPQPSMPRPSWTGQPVVQAIPVSQVQRGYAAAPGQPSGQMPAGSFFYGQWMPAEAMPQEPTWEQRELPAKIAGYTVYAGSAILLSSLVLSVFLLPIVHEIIDAKFTLLGYLLCGGTIVQFLFCVAGFGAGYYIKQSSTGAAILAVIGGAIAILLSLVIIGGLLGAIGALLILIGGGVGLVV